MNTYKMRGTYKIKSAVLCQAFLQKLRATSPKAAMDKGRAILVSKGCYNILYLSVCIKDGKDWKLIPMMQALELE